MSNVTLRNVNLLRLGMYITAHAQKKTGRFTACAKAHADGQLLSGQTTIYSENSCAFMEGSEESCSSGHGPREAGPARAHS